MPASTAPTPSAPTPAAHAPADGVHVRPATAADAAAIAQLLGSIGWFAAYQHGSRDTHTQRVQALMSHAPGSSAFWVAERRPNDAAPIATSSALPSAAPAAAQIVGYCALHWLPVAVQLGEEAYVSELFVHDSARGTGTGSALLHAATDAARARGSLRMWLLNNRERTSYQRGFYAQQGWHEQPEMARFVLPLT